MPSVAAFALGLLFALGLGLSGLSSPDRILGFIDFAGDWDPSLLVAFAIGSSIYALAFWWIRPRRPSPLCSASYQLPASSALDRRLFAGAILFGIGWGLGGICPGPAFVSLATLRTSSFLFAGAMVLGFALENLLRRAAIAPPSFVTDNLSAMR